MWGNKMCYMCIVYSMIGFSDLVDLWVIKIKTPMILCARSTFFLDCAFGMLIGWVDKLRSHGNQWIVFFCALWLATRARDIHRISTALRNTMDARDRVLISQPSFDRITFIFCRWLFTGLVYTDNYQPLLRWIFVKYTQRKIEDGKSE